MNCLPQVSLVVVVFNGVTEIARTLDSIFSQDYKNIEYIVIDGESNDGTQDIIARYQSKIDMYVSEPDEGVYDAMNKAIERSSGEFILFMNCGDVFASTYAVSIAMRSVNSGIDQIVLGAWMRRLSDKNLQLCHPVLEEGLFNHQATLYSRHIHSWHGNYLNVKGLTTADYLFFVTLFDSSKVTCTVVDATLAVIDVTGLSAGPQTLSQKFAIDFICGRTSKVQLLLVLVAHPVYRRIKSFLRWMQ